MKWETKYKDQDNKIMYWECKIGDIKININSIGYDGSYKCVVSSCFINKFETEAVCFRPKPEATNEEIQNIAVSKIIEYLQAKAKKYQEIVNIISKEDKDAE
jgi:peptide subunit release factor 1 (eRF1)